MSTIVNGMKVIMTNQRNVVLQSSERSVIVKIPEMITVAGGTFTMGRSFGSDICEEPIRQITISDFKIGKYPVTNEEYLGFLRVRYEERKIPDLMLSPDFALHPVTNVSWKDADEYCGFLREITETDDGKFMNFRLPTEAEWEYAARASGGGEIREYPWGDDPYEGRVNFNSGGTTPVDAFPQGATPSGIFDMSGNVWEWVGDWFGRYDENDLIDPKGPKYGVILKVMRGGSWYFEEPGALYSAYRDLDDPEALYFDAGFRVAKELNK